MALELLSRRESRKDLWPRLITLLLLYFMLLLSLLLLHDAWSYLKMLVFDRLGFPPSLLAFCSSVHRYNPFNSYRCICSVDPCLRVLWMSTHGCFAPPFPPFFFFPVDATRCRSPGARCHRRCLLLRGDRRRPGVVRRLPGRRPCLFDRCYFCASLLKAKLSNSCLYSDIIASADSCVFELMYSSPRGPWLVI